MDDAARRLLSLENKIQTNYGLKSKPLFYMIIVGSDYSYKRPDGFLAVPYTTLKP